MLGVTVRRGAGGRIDTGRAAGDQVQHAAGNDAAQQRRDDAGPQLAGVCDPLSLLCLAGAGALLEVRVGQALCAGAGR